MNKDVDIDLSSIPTDTSGLQNYLKNAKVVQLARNFFNADEYTVTIDGIQLLLKTCVNRNFFVRLLFSRHILLQECKLTQSLHHSGLANIPAAYGHIGKDTIATQFIQNISKLENPRHHSEFTVPPKSFFAELIDMVRNLHAHGMAHGDIRRANILVGTDGHPWLIDLASAIIIKENSSWIKKRIFNNVRQADLYALAKIVFSYYPDWQDEELQQAISEQSRLLKFARFLRQKLYHHKQRKK